MDKPLVSIVVPVYNMEESIYNCVKSILEQSYSNIEVILVDDGSTDQSYKVCQKLEKEDSRIQLIHTDNRGAGPARNTGIENATGKYICFPDADDMFVKDSILDLVMGMKDGNHDFVVSGYRNLDNNGKIVFERKFSDFTISGDELRNNYSLYIKDSASHTINGTPWAKLFNLDVIHREHILFPPLRRHQDTAFIDLYLNVVKSVHFISSITYIHYVNDLKKEWDKYPVNYIDSVVGLYEYMCSTVLRWNPDDKVTEDVIFASYLSRVIKAMELTYSTKMELTRQKRKKWIIDVLRRIEIEKIRIPLELDWYHSVVIKLLKKKKYNIAMLVMYIKVLSEKSGILGWIR